MTFTTEQRAQVAKMREGRDPLTYAEIARRMGWFLKDGKPHASKAHRATLPPSKRKRGRPPNSDRPLLDVRRSAHLNRMKSDFKKLVSYVLRMEKRLRDAHILK